MTDNIEIRESVPGDLAAISLLYPEAFPDEDLLPLVRELLQESAVTLPLVVITGSGVVGHIIFTKCSLVGSSGEASLLGPLAVAPARRKECIGSALVRAGLQRLEDAGVSQVYVLGDPAYYGRFGFAPESRVAPPYTLPPEWEGAWQSKSLGDAATSPAGKLSLPGPWLQPALWAP